MCATTRRVRSVDHIVNRRSGGTDAPSNLGAICDTCHTEKTQREAFAGRQRRKYRDSVAHPSRAP
ncbi:HNH endonuclease [Pseudonocardia sp. ICBG1142]|uniref:HNH endonuclease n=1 Tax=unclassified Pseudonocardia TaxID=2619320 RepID=UPI001CF629ED